MRLIFTNSDSVDSTSYYESLNSICLFGIVIMSTGLNK